MHLSWRDKDAKRAGYPRPHKDWDEKPEPSILTVRTRRHKKPHRFHVLVHYAMGTWPKRTYPAAKCHTLQEAEWCAAKERRFWGDRCEVKIVEIN